MKEKVPTGFRVTDENKTILGAKKRNFVKVPYFC